MHIFNRIMLSAFCLLAVLLIGHSSAEAFDYNGQAWCCRGVGYCVNPEEPPNTCPSGTDRTFVDIINKAAATWNGQGTMFQLIYNGPTTERGCEPDPSSPVLECMGKLDGQNTVSLSDGCTFPAGILATAWWWYTTGSGTEEDCCIFEADICFNRDEEWYMGDDAAGCTGSSCHDLESVALHEFGHWISLGHEDDEAVLGYRPVMFSNYNFCELRRTLTPDDINGLTYVYDPANVILWPERCDPIHSHVPVSSPKVPVTVQCDQPACDATSCPPGPPFCDSVTTDPCLVICPASDIVWTATIKDSCGNPICDMTNTWLEFNTANCPAQPCPGEEPDWPRVYPDSCDPLTGVHYFTVDAGALDCVDCQVPLFVNGAVCRTIPAKFLDITGDLCVTAADWLGVTPCNDYNCDGTVDNFDVQFWQSHFNHCCQDCNPGPPFCDSVTYDPCLVVCPASDIVWRATVKDSCGNPICDLTGGIFLEIGSDCAAIPCPGEEPNWPIIYPDSCDNATGTHFFTVDAGALTCTECTSLLFVNGLPCANIPTRFLDINGDLCVTQADWLGAPCNDYNCDGAVDNNDQAFWASHLDHCCQSCDPGPPFCDSTTYDPCLLVCPASDIVWTATIKDSCGNPICGPVGGTYLDFANCPAIPCPGEEPNWPLVFPDSCDPATGVHYFTVDAGALDCVDCTAILVVDGAVCAAIPTKFLDTNGDLCVTPNDWLDAPCNDYNCNGTVDPTDVAIFNSHLDHCCPGCDPGPPFCDSTIVDPCLVVCPASDIVWRVIVRDSCGNPICDPNTWLDFSSCEAKPCPKEEPNWPLVFPDSCDPATGEHFFTVDASMIGGATGACPDCPAVLYVNGQPCRTVLARFLDVNGDLCVTQADWIGDPLCNDYNCNGNIDAADMAIFNAHLDHCCENCCDLRGDINNDGSVDIGDLTYLVDYLFNGGPPPPCLDEADVNGDGSVDISDLTYMVDYFFGGGPAPVPC